jgi:hypothetical protein
MGTYSDGMVDATSTYGAGHVAASVKPVLTCSAPCSVAQCLATNQAEHDVKVFTYSV